MATPASGRRRAGTRRRAQVVDVRPLVGRVDQARGQFDVHRSQREEAVRHGPNASRSQCESVKPAQHRGASFAPGSVSPTQSEIAVQSGVSSDERVPPKRSIVSSSYSPSPRIWRDDRLDVLRRLPGKKAAVDDELARARDHVRRSDASIIVGERVKESRGSIVSTASWSTAARRESTSAGAGCSPSTASRKPATSGPIVGSGPVGGELLDQRRRLDEGVVRDPRHGGMAAAAVDDERGTGRSSSPRSRRGRTRGPRARCARRRPR